MIAISLDRPGGASPTTVSAEEITAAQLANELNMDAKKLRVKLRALARDGRIADCSGRWTWPSDSPDLKVIREAR